MTVATTEPTSRAMGAFNERDEQLLRYLGLNPSNPADRAAVAVCRVYDFDPLLKHVVVIPKGGVYITRDGLLHVAHRSGQLDGIVVEQDPVLDDATGEWVAKVSVYRKDMAHPFTYPGRYPKSGMNRDYAPEMALKAAEAHALRRAFDVTGLPTVEERKPGAVQAQPQSVGLGAVLGEQSAEEVQEGEVVESPPLDMRSPVAKRMFAVLGELGIRDEEQHEWLSDVLDRRITSRKDLTEADARLVITEGERRLERPFDDAPPEDAP